MPNDAWTTIFNYGMSGLICAYFIYKDYKFSSDQLALTGKVVHLLERLEAVLPAGGESNEN